MGENLKNALQNIKKQMLGMEEDLYAQMRDLDKQGIKWFQYDEETENLRLTDSNKKVKLNIGGMQIQTTLGTLLRIPDTLFSNLILSHQWDTDKELFIDRSFKYFHYILSYMRFKEVDLEEFAESELKILYNEACFYEIGGLVELLFELKDQVKFVSFEFNGAYVSGQTAGTNDINDINNVKDRSCMKGICANYPGWILFTLNREATFSMIEVGGFSGNTNIFANTNGSNCQIMTSLDKISWTSIGQTHSDYNNIKILNVTKTKAKYIKFQHNSYLGIGYLRIITK